MTDAVEVAFHRGRARGLRRAPHVLVAVSGGGDSVALLHLLRASSRSGAST
jgi:tRNA(Ile)-lysidine synthase TilS/MesJ